MPNAAYDEIAEWYEHQFLPTQRVSATGVEDPLGINQALRHLLGPAPSDTAPCLEIGCGSGAYAQLMADLGWTPLGVDLSSAMLAYARDRLPVTLGDAESLPIGDTSVEAVAAVMAHTDMPGYLHALDEVARVLQPGGMFVHVGVHPCFCGGFADRSDPAAVVIRPGYLDGHWTTDSWTTNGVRDKVGASHWPLASLLNGVIERGLTIEAVTEGGQPTPVVLALRARKPQPEPTP